MLLKSIMCECCSYTCHLRSLASMQTKADALMNLHDDLAEIKAEHGDSVPDKPTLGCMFIVIGPIESLSNAGSWKSWPSTTRISTSCSCLSVRMCLHGPRSRCFVEPTLMGRSSRITMEEQKLKRNLTCITCYASACPHAYTASEDHPACQAQG